MKPIVSSESCLYCNGQGYFHLIVGGTENCPQCQGSGQNGEEKAIPLPVFTAR